MALYARFKGTCVVCRKPIEVGQKILWSREAKGKAAHENCSEAPDAPKPMPLPQLSPISSTPEPSNADILDAVKKAIAEALSTKTSHDDVKELIKENSLGQKAVENIVREAVRNAQPLRIEIVDDKGEQITLIENAHEKMPTLLYLLRKRHHAYLWGGPGSGKSTGAEMAAKALGLDYGYISLNPQTPDSRLLGFLDANGVYRETVFMRLYRDGGVFCIDELDNSSASLLTTLNGALEGKKAAFPCGMIDRHPDFVVVGTGNTVGKGANPQFPDRRPFDSAFAERFTYLEWQYDMKLEEHVTLGINPKAKDWLAWVRRAREYCKAQYPKVLISPRAAFKGAEYLKDDVLTVADIAEAVVFKGLDATTKAAILNEVPLPGTVVVAKNVGQVQIGNDSSSWSDADNTMVERLIKSSRFIEAIKYRRERTGEGLVQAKQYVDYRRQGMRL